MVVRAENFGGGGSTPRPQRIAKKTTIASRPSSLMSSAPQRQAPQTTIRRAPAPQRSAPRQVSNNSRPSVSPVRQPAPARSPMKTNSGGQVRSNSAPKNSPARKSNPPGGKFGNPKQNNTKPATGPDRGRPVNTPKTAQGAINAVGAPSINDYLSSDSDYQGGISELMRTLQQFKSGNQASQGDVQSAFKTAMERMGQEREQSLKSLQEDFASRGLLNSGLYAQANSDYDTTYNQRIGDLTKDQSDQLGNLQGDASNFEGLNQSQQAALRAEALRRRADKYNVTA